MDSKREATWTCENCRGNLPVDRLCEETPLGVCSKHGEFTEDEAEFNDDTSRHICPECGGKLRWKLDFRLGNKYLLHSCPIGRMETRAIFWVKIVNWSESTGCMPYPGALLDQPNTYFEIRDIVIREKILAEEELRPKEERTPDARQQGKVYKIGRKNA